MEIKCPKCAAKRTNITSIITNVAVRGFNIGSSTTYRCNLCGHKWKENTNEVTTWSKSKKI